MNDLLLHACCGPCATVALPAWRERGVEPLVWHRNPNIQPELEALRRLDALRRYCRAAEAQLVVDERSPGPAWRSWQARQHSEDSSGRCALCFRLRLGGAAAAAAARGMRRFSTTLSVSPYQRHDLLVAAGEAAGEEHGVRFVYLDLRESFRESYAACRRYELYRQRYCGCAASKWEAWHERRARKARA